MNELAGTGRLYVILNLFCALTLVGAEPPPPTNIVRIHMMKRDSVVFYPNGEGPPIITLVEELPREGSSPGSDTSDDSDPDPMNAQNIDHQIDRYLTELRNQDNNQDNQDEQPGLLRQAGRRDLAVSPPPRRLSFWERVASWCSCSRERRR